MANLPVIDNTEQLFSLFDRVAGKMVTPWVSNNKATAMRALTGALLTDEQLSKNHQDYDLYMLGEWTKQGRITPPEHGPSFVCTLSSLKAS
ncbi:MAG: nonstructural protein [Microvirus sp.]|nr:MAG: nonstructural protein [Microvirus sp.]